MLTFIAPGLIIHTRNGVPCFAGNVHSFVFLVFGLSFGRGVLLFCLLFSDLADSTELSASDGCSSHSVRSTAMFSLPLAILKGARGRFADKNVEMVSLSLKSLKTANTSLGQFEFGQMKRADTLHGVPTLSEV